MKKNNVWTFVIIVGILLKLWLVSGQHLSAIPYSLHDDAGFLQKAGFILDGKWLGTYDHLTLIKGPFYSVWIALMVILGLPLLFSQHLLYIFSCLMLILAIKPWIKSKSFQLIIFLILLFNPISFTDGVMTRVLRDGIYPSLMLLVTAFSLGLMLRTQNSYKRRLFWSIGLGLSLSFFWLTREEGIWIIPLLAVLAINAIFTKWHQNKKPLFLEGSQWGTAILIWLVIVVIFNTLNYSNYGVFSKTEFDSRIFKSAYGALTRIKTNNSLHMVQVSREARNQIYKVSPSFAELQPYLEGDIGKFWSDVSLPKTEDTQGEITGWFMWAFRDAVSAAGYYDDGKFPKEYYLKIEEEISSACADGRLDCYSSRSTMMPPWKNSYFEPLFKTFFKNILFVAKFEDFSPYSIPGTGTEIENRLFQDLTKERLTGENQEIIIDGWAFGGTEVIKFSVINSSNIHEFMTFEEIIRPDVYEHHKENGIDNALSLTSGFKIRTACLSNCNLVIHRSGVKLESVPIQPNMETTITNDEISLVIDSATLISKFPVQSQFDEIKITYLRKIGYFYQKLIPYAFVFSFVPYIYISFMCVKNKQITIIWVVLSSFLIGLLSRLVLVSLIQVLSIPITGTIYTSPSYPLLLVFVCISAGIGLGKVWKKFEFGG